MLKTSKYKVFIIGGILVLTLATALAFAINPRILGIFKPRETPQAKKAIPPAALVYDEASIRKLEDIAKNLDFGRPTYTITGNITVVNKEDSTQTMNAVAFILCKNKNEFYYKEGETETINQGGAYITINDRTKRVLVSPEKHVNTISIINIDQIKEALRSEKYQLHSTKKNNEETISMLNEYHISCKEYNLTYDTVSNKLTRVYTRLTNIHDPLNKAKDKIIDIRFTRSDNQADMNDYVTKNKVIYKSGKQWNLTAQYADYQLIQL
ncbi:hypothetical protein BEL04_03470 [Mucilaginibacter sp. PPCGB 2223]|uniref:hypothetical protein n=1 Tax=Mucilaginibacter sp. PPCGB 2223 TaxID=1886027 RepID=UPI000825E6EE|nr:hypothetical protein [Mucilaginibacter sp. PPCGB 2223]OCX53373.1 hypothetical protein BEL04_03470 [Mucilaginibacter sp. PPCGB 2223]